MSGYTLQVMRRAIEGREPTLPAWEEWGRLAKDGLLKEQPKLAVLFPLLFLISMAALFLSMTIGSVLLILGVIPLPVATAHFIAHDQVSAAFRIREWCRLLWANKLVYLIAFVIIAGLFVIGYVAMMVVTYTCILLPLVYLVMLPFGFYLSLVSAVLFGQTYRESAAMVRRGG